MNLPKHVFAVLYVNSINITLREYFGGILLKQDVLYLRDNNQYFGRMCVINCEAPLKIMIENLSYFVKSQGSWLYKPEKTNKFSLSVNKIMIQGEICSTAGFDNEIIILNDGTAKAKVTRDSQVPGEFSWLKPGVHCTVIGSLLCNGKLPHIAAIKISEITNEILCKMWLSEVTELKDVLLNRISIELPGVQ